MIEDERHLKSPSRLTPSDPRHQMHVAVGPQCLIPGILINLAIDRDGHLIQVIGDQREAVAQRSQEFGRGASITTDSAPPVYCVSPLGRCTVAIGLAVRRRSPRLAFRRQSARAPAMETA